MAIQQSIKSEEKTLFIDLSEKAAKAKVVREGYQVPAATFDKSKAAFQFDQFVEIAPKSLPRVVSQSVPAGTKVTKGTVVDLVLVPRSSVPFDIFDGVHSDLKGKSVEYLTENMLTDAKARQIVLTYENADDVPPADKTYLQTLFAQQQVTFDETQTDKNFKSGYNSARGALAFR
jgi:hypothetical protein